MERNLRKTRKQGRKVPSVPIKTYKWEDIRRSRRKGGYPWTHLYKRPFSGNFDTADYKMDSILKFKRKTAKKEQVENCDDSKDIDETETVSESHTDIENHSTVSTHDEVEENLKQPEPQPEATAIESAESSDNISQYLDKEETGPTGSQTIESTETLTMLRTATPEMSVLSVERKERAKSEELKPKRKLSIDSSYSRISLSKLGIIKRLKEAKDKMKLPKFGLPTSKEKISSQPKKESSKPKVKQAEKATNVVPIKDVKPVYIHIPLKPPDGKTDEFSYLEFESKVKPEIKVEVTETENDNQMEIEPLEVEDNECAGSSLAPGMSDNDDDISAIIVLDGDEEGGADDDYNIMVIDVDDNSKEIQIEEVVNSNLKRQVLESIKKAESQGDLSSKNNNRHVSDALLSRSSSKSSLRQTRAKSAEPERKRKLSADSAYSRKSMSKLGFLKKIKDAAEKLHVPHFSRSSSKKELNKTEEVKPTVSKEPIKKEEGNKNVQPTYIHIPLKPPLGKTDEFSYLEFENKSSNIKKEVIISETTEIESHEKETPESPQSVESNDIQFIYLTPPSDDEVLDDKHDIPETPLSETKFFDYKVNELKDLARDVVDKISPESRRKQLQAVSEESDNKTSDPEKMKQDGIEITEEKSQITEPNEQANKEENMIIDEEDGLKSAAIIVDEESKNGVQTLKSSLKTEGSPVLKKKVSFKRRNTNASVKNGSYEDIQDPSNDSTEKKVIPSSLPALENDRSMSLEEEKTYLDETVIKSTSLDEDYNKWSKLNDHEYEPINPPPNEMKTAQPKAQIHLNTMKPSFTSFLEHEPRSNETVENANDLLSAQILQTEIEDRYFNAPSNSGSSKISSSSGKSKSGRSATPTPVAQPKTPEKQKSEKYSKLQASFKLQAGKVKTKLQGIKKPTITMPKRPKFSKPNMPKFSMPKLPDTAAIHLPAFSLSRNKSNKESAKRQYSTESNVGDSKKHIFDFNTYPRFFKKKKENNLTSSSSSKGTSEFNTVPRTRRQKESSKQTSPEDRWGGSDSIRVPLHSEDSMDGNNVEYFQEKPAASPRYDKNIEMDDAYEKENQEIHQNISDNFSRDSRWNHGSFHRQETKRDFESGMDRSYKVTDLDTFDDAPNNNFDMNHSKEVHSSDGSLDIPSHDREVQSNNFIENRDEDRGDQSNDFDANHNKDIHSSISSIGKQRRGILQEPNNSFDTNHSKDMNSSVSSLGIHRPGVLEEIDSDEFFLRQKGISQDNIDVGKYLSSEIREAFRPPVNALSQMDHFGNGYDVRASNQSLPETKRKQIKKPKRKKTPHVSHERVSFDQESEADEYRTIVSPSRPKRRSKKSKKIVEDCLIPYQETIQAEHVETREAHSEREDFPSDEELQRYRIMYENQEMEGRQNPEIHVTESYKAMEFENGYLEPIDNQDWDENPVAPQRKQRSTKSLNLSEHDSIMGEYNADFDTPIEDYFQNQFIFTPKKTPSKPARSRRRSQSQEEEDFINTEEQEDSPPRRPSRNRSRTRSQSQLFNTPEPYEETPSIDDNTMITYENQIPCIEPLCIEDIRDAMGYAIVDKQKQKEQQVPTTPSRRNKSDQKFFTVPRSVNENQPTRPLRNYSTLGPSRPPRKLVRNLTDEEKENIDITQYIEIEDERDLQSGEVIQKMQNRPLPAPPRPPRKSRTLQDIISDANSPVHKTDVNEKEIEQEICEETEVSTQTEPLSDDFVCEEVIQEDSDRIMTPTNQRDGSPSLNDDILESNTDEQCINDSKKLTTPTHYTYEETITHGTLIVEPLNGAKILPDEELCNHKKSEERIIKVEYDEEEETSEIPEEFKLLADSKLQPQHTITEPIIKSVPEKEVELLKAQKLQVQDLDVDRLTVKEVLASRITVSEIDSSNIQTNEISSKTGALRLGDIELPPSIIQELLRQLQMRSQEEQIVSQELTPSPTNLPEDNEKNTNLVQKKTPIDLDQTSSIANQLSSNENQLSEPDDNSSSEDNVGILSQRPPEEIVKANLDEQLHEDISNEHVDIEDISSSHEFEGLNEDELLPEIEDDKVPIDLAVPTEPPTRPPRNAEKCKPDDTSTKENNPREMEEPDIDDQPPPRPPQPHLDYIPSQPPLSFYALRAQTYVEGVNEDIPAIPRRKRIPKTAAPRSSSSESVVLPISRRRYRSPEPSISQLSGQLIQACSSSASNSLKRLIEYISNVIEHSDITLDAQAVTVILLVLIAGLILLGYGEGKTVHLHHWEYFNPPRDM